MKLLSLDIDGVLHPARDSIFLNFRPGTPVWQLELALKAQSRFIWAPILTELVADTDVSIVIHSTWRKRFDDATIKHFLPPAVASRVIHLDGQIEGRETLSSDDYLSAALELIAPTSVCVVDDRREFFDGGKVKNWIAHNSGKFVWCDPDVGIQANQVRQELRSWSRSEPTYDHFSVPDQ